MDIPIKRKLLKKETHNHQVCFRLSSKLLCNDLLKHGVMPNKSFKIKLPNISDIFLPHFIRGYFDGDGCVYTCTKETKKKNQIRIHISSNLEFLTGVNSAINIVDFKIRKTEVFLEDIYLHTWIAIIFTTICIHQQLFL